MKVYLTGNRGFIATHLAEELRAHGHEVQGGDIVDGIDFTLPGVAEAEFSYKPDVVIHTAAQVGRVFGEDDTSHTIRNNALMSVRVAQACAERDIRLCYISTSEVYGDQGDAECIEGGQLQLPHNLYGLSKFWGEQVSALYAPKGLQVVRLSMPFGPGLPAGRGRAAIINFLYNSLHNLAIPVHKDSERSWCWIGDTVRGFRMVLESGERAYSASEYEAGIGIYNIGRSDNAVSMQRVAEIACELTGGSQELIEMIDAPANQTKVKRLSNAKLRALDWLPEVELEEGMERTLEWVKIQ